MLSLRDVLEYLLILTHYYDDESGINTASFFVDILYKFLTGKYP